MSNNQTVFRKMQVKALYSQRGRGTLGPRQGKAFPPPTQWRHFHCFSSPRGRRLKSFVDRNIINCSHINTLLQPYTDVHLISSFNHLKGSVITFLLIKQSWTFFFCRRMHSIRGNIYRAVCQGLLLLNSPHSHTPLTRIHLQTPNQAAASKHSLCSFSQT